jgi:hypothetical protein
LAAAVAAVMQLQPQVVMAVQAVAVQENNQILAAQEHQDKEMLVVLAVPLVIGEVLAVVVLVRRVRRLLLLWMVALV